MAGQRAEHARGNRFPPGPLPQAHAGDAEPRLCRADPPRPTLQRSAVVHLVDAISKARHSGVWVASCSGILAAMSFPLRSIGLGLAAMAALACESRKAPRQDISAEVSASSKAPAANDVRPPPKPPLTGESFCERIYGKAYAAFLARCSDEDRKVRNQHEGLSGFDFVSLVEGMALAECNYVFRDGVKAERLAFDASSAEQCAAAAEKLATAGVGLGGTLHLVGIPACSSSFTGKQAMGMPCRTTFECRAPLSCIGRNQEDRACQPVPARVGAACDDTLRSHDFPNRERCGPGLACVGSRCKRVVPAGGACVTSDQCAQGLRCQARRCSAVSPSDVGGACASGDLLANWETSPSGSGAFYITTLPDDCRPGLFCSVGKKSRLGTCAARKGAGSPCSSQFDCRGACSIPLGETEGTCVALCGSG